ncbi:MAG: adenosylmethionine--8-amino-7-oxononanoate transaminase [Alphaproteobacteria bacterium]|nr:adenosylmethionine--8-amino-7-oxononanoate transaminase [Alphaproteobacteria bacterium]
MDSLLVNDANHVWHPLRQAQTDITVTPILSAKGSVLYGENGQEYLDMVSSWWVNLHGHAHPKIAKAIFDQAQTLEQVIFADLTHKPAVELASRLARLLPEPLTRVFFSDNGSTAVEVALKISYQYWHNQGQGYRKRFISFEGGYHGDTFGAMAAGNAAHFHAPFQEFLFDVDVMPYPHTFDGDREIEQKEASALQHFKDHLEKYGNQTASLIIEPLLQGSSGMRMCRPVFLQKMVAMAKSYGILVIFDEIMTGFGRTGSFFACQKASVTPDLICLSKGLTGGFLPLSVTVASESIYKAFLGDTFDKAFAHSHSFTANPLGCAAALASLELFEEENTLQKIKQIETWHHHHMAKLSKHPNVIKARIMGTIAAFDIKSEESKYALPIVATLKKAFLERGLLIRPLGNVVYLMPPYCTTEKQLTHAYDSIREVLDQI